MGREALASQLASGDEDLEADGRRPAPGKVTLTQWLAPRRPGLAAAPPAPPPAVATLQADGGAVLDDDPFALHLTAQRGVDGVGDALPHLPQLQRAFGHHDLSGVRAHVGGAAADASAAIGAAAYATGNDVAFAATPDLRQAAHEAAHVVQQRGGVRLDGGVGRVGDVYEQHADAVADLVTRGESAESLLDTMAHRGAAGGPAVQRIANAVGIHEGWRTDAAERAALAERFTDVLGHPVEPTAEALEAAIREFQASHADEIDAVAEHSDDMLRTYDGPVEGFAEPRPPTPGRDAPAAARTAARAELRAWAARRAAWLRGRRATSADDGRRAAPGDLDPNDATHIALTNAWPRRFFGVLLQTAADGYDYLKSQVQARGLPFDDDRVNIVGVRGLSGGVAHTDVGTGLAASTYDDSFFVLALDAEGGKMIREFRGTTEPGGRSTEHRTAHPDEYGPRERSAAVADHDVEAMEADQQVVYHFTTADTSKLGRPTLTPRVTDEDGAGLVVAPTRAGEPTVREDDPRLHGDESDLADSVAATDPRLHDRLRTRRGDETLDRSLGIAIHSGYGGDAVNADSTGCQVVHGDWYGDFTATLQAALTAARTRHGEHPTRPATDGDVLYSLLDAATLQRGEAAMRAGIARARSGGQVVDGDGGVVGDEATVHGHAERGVTGAGQELPHLATIAASFGHHDVSGVRAHVGGAAAEAAAAIGARAYATGDAVAFAATPDLRQAAHEAAHVVQQRGGVRLDGGVGRAGDAYEQHADAVAAAVVRGESAEALLDTMAHRGAGGGAAVQRDDLDGDGVDDATGLPVAAAGGAPPVAEPDLAALIDACERPNELVAARDALAHPEHVAAARRRPARTFARFTLAGREFTVERAELRTARERIDARLAARPAGEWRPPARPEVGQTWMGYRVEEDGDAKVLRVNGVTLRFAQFPRGSGEFHGFQYRDTSGSLPRVRDQMIAEYERGGHAYSVAAARGMEVLGEGGTAALNTYDNLALTIGPGYGGGRLDDMLARLRGTPAGDALAAAPYLGGLRYNGDHAVKLDVEALATIVTTINGHLDAVARAEVEEYVQGSGRAPADGSEAGARADAAAAATDPAVVGVAAYLCHGRNAFTPSPAEDVTAAVAAFPHDQSCQVAMLLKLHAERILAWNTDGNAAHHRAYHREAREAMTRRLPAKITHFTEVKRQTDRGFHFDFDAARARVMGCITAGSSWPGTTTAPDGPYLEAELDDVATYWKLGPG